MQKWEYCEVEVTYQGNAPADVFLCFYKPDGKHVEHKTNRAGVIFAKLGLDGWELVSSNNRVDGVILNLNQTTHLFKRPIEP